MLKLILIKENVPDRFKTFKYFFGRNTKFDFLTGGKFSKNGPLKSDFEKNVSKRSVNHYCDGPI